MYKTVYYTIEPFKNRNRNRMIRKPDPNLSGYWMVPVFKCLGFGYSLYLEDCDSDSACPNFADLYGELSRSDLISLTLSYDQKVKALTEEVCLLQKEMNQARYYILGFWIISGFTLTCCDLSSFFSVIF
jgi:hypothetical protein